MLTAGFILIVAVIITFVLGYGRINIERETRLASALTFDEATAEKPFEENSLFRDICLVQYDLQKHQIVSWHIGNGANWNKERLKLDVVRIAHSNNTSGLLRLHIRYVKSVSEDGNTVKIAFNNRNSYDDGIMTYFWWMMGALSVGLLFYLVFSIMFARMAIRPVERSWQSQKQFVADASHELKTPLSVIRASTDMIATRPDETVESQMQWVNNIQQESKRMATLVSDLLTLVKTDDGLQIQMENVDLSDCLNAVVLGYEPVFYEHNKEFTYEIAPYISIEGNADQLKQLATILLDNADKYSRGKGNINMTLTANMSNAQITVSNDCEQLNDEQLERLFDRFYTVDPSRNKKVVGNGLGLSIAQMICASHQGSITVDCVDSRITFTVILPWKNTIIGQLVPQKNKNKNKANK